MFECTHTFEEIPFSICTGEYALFSGTALLEGEDGPHDYGFKCIGIELAGNLIGDFADKRKAIINAKSDDPLHKLLFERLAKAIEASDSASTDYYSAVEQEAA